jgi:hypothetical protein
LFLFKPKFVFQPFTRDLMCEYFVRPLRIGPRTG